tara:strand:+ start:1588 stop:2094 length:507 start_codon:yes stop_codon:yes gene_type:complete
LSEKLYCPKWIFDIAVVATANDYLLKDILIDVSAKKFVRGLNTHYQEIKLLEIKYGAEAIISFLGSIKKPTFEPCEGLRQFLFFTLKYEKKFFLSRKRFKKLIGSPFDGTKKKGYNEDKTLADFKKYIYSLRANLVEKAPMSWSINDDQEEDLQFLKPLLTDNLLDSI